MKFKAIVSIIPRKELLDPQGKAVKLGLGHLGLTSIHDVRVGKHIELELEAENAEDAEYIVQTACQKLLVNPIMESYSFTWA